MPPTLTKLQRPQARVHCAAPNSTRTAAPPLRPQVNVALLSTRAILSLCAAVANISAGNVPLATASAQDSLDQVRRFCARCIPLASRSDAVRGAHVWSK